MAARCLVPRFVSRPVSRLVSRPVSRLASRPVSRKVAVCSTPRSDIVEFLSVFFTDTYKLSHPEQYPTSIINMTAKGGFRKSFKGIDGDNRFITYGGHDFEKFLRIKWTKEDVDFADHFFSTYNIGHTQHPFPKQLFMDFIEETGGYFPVKIQALPDGSVALVGTPIYQITASGKYASIVTFLETRMVQLWYPSTVATLSRMTKDIIFGYFEKTVDDEFYFLIDSRLHDFGMRGCTCMEQAKIGGIAHLLNFTGSDNGIAAATIQYQLNNGIPYATSIPASEHSVMMSDGELTMVKRLIENTPENGFISIVADTYDYDWFLNFILPAIGDMVKAKNITLIIRPDSGDPVEAVIAALNAADSVFGSNTNNKGFKVLKNSGVIQGDGININTIGPILEAVMNAGFSAQNVVFGMGGGLLQGVNRDTMSFATKLSEVIYEDDTKREVMKAPITDSGKTSLPGKIDVGKDSNGVPRVYPANDLPIGFVSDYVTIWDSGPVIKESEWPLFKDLVKKVEAEWTSLEPFKQDDPLSDVMKAKKAKKLAEIRESIKNQQADMLSR